MSTRAWMFSVGLLFIASVSFAQAQAQAQAQAHASPDPQAPPPSGCTMPGHETYKQALPDVQQLGAVSVLTGGIGVDEARAMRGERAKYPLALTFVESFGAKNRFLAHILVEITRDDGSPVLCATSAGPYMFVDLPPGKYRILAETDGGRAIERTATVTAGGHVDLDFVWPASGGAH